MAKKPGVRRLVYAAPLGKKQRACVCSSGGGGGGEEGGNAKASRPGDDSTTIFSSLQAASRLQGRQNRNNRGTKVVLAGDGSEDTWRKLDKRVNRYPGQRDFTAIGQGDGFQASMVHAVEKVVGSVHIECISQKTRGNWVSVTIGPVWVENGDQVLAIYEAMRQDERLKWFI